ncbi:MAG TPA: glycerophosphodiester phosphodiesterase [Flavobacteriaceae bacterium]|nr:glycerophosphodiester phosphodiesterase [Flavobacteriaceae bacterium]HAT63838.1 glycerophosphodiester phosphodiesterase [Flavobacteriaceae bacterium]|tara:strand:- start:1229 stop:2107 length:879 start_codon:yes stop_codon:yes gene_type:complete
MDAKIVIAHRGASGYLPEHTLPAKAMAYAMHPDYLEQDVVLSKDDIPIVIHDIHLDAVTNVAKLFPDRKRKDGRYYVIDFTFEELKTLSVVERFNLETGEVVFPKRFPKGKSRFGLHSLQEEIELIQGLNKSTGNNIGIYPEIKEPTFHRKEGKDISEIVLKVLSDYGYTSKKDPCILQCFDASELRRIREELKSDLFLVQLMEFENEIPFIPQFAEYADGIGPWINLLHAGPLMKLAKDNNLKVHAYTLRKDNLPTGETFSEILKEVLFKHNVDGVFTDHPDTVIQFLKNN